MYKYPVRVVTDNLKKTLDKINKNAGSDIRIEGTDIVFERMGEAMMFQLMDVWHLGANIKKRLFTDYCDHYCEHESYASLSFLAMLTGETATHPGEAMQLWLVRIFQPYFTQISSKLTPCINNAVCFRMELQKQYELSIEMMCGDIAISLCVKGSVQSVQLTAVFHTASCGLTREFVMERISWAAQFTKCTTIQHAQRFMSTMIRRPLLRLSEMLLEQWFAGSLMRHLTQHLPSHMAMCCLHSIHTQAENSIDPHEPWYGLCYYDSRRSDTPPLRINAPTALLWHILSVSFCSSAKRYAHIQALKHNSRWGDMVTIALKNNAKYVLLSAENEPCTKALPAVLSFLESPLDIDNSLALVFYRAIEGGMSAILLNTLSPEWRRIIE